LIALEHTLLSGFYGSLNPSFPLLSVIGALCVAGLLTGPEATFFGRYDRRPLRTIARDVLRRWSSRQSAEGDARAGDRSLQPDPSRFPGLTRSPFRPLSFRLLLDAIGETGPTVDYMVDGFQSGFDCGLRPEAIHVPEAIVYRNPPMEARLEALTDRGIREEFGLGWIGGGSPSPPFATFISSPIGAVWKKEFGRPLDKSRRTHNLSKGGDASVNSKVKPEFASVKYSSVDDAVRLVGKVGTGCFCAKIDLRSAYRSVPLSPSVYHLFVFWWLGAFFFEARMGFGCSSSPAIFTWIAAAVAAIMKRCFGLSTIVFYLDDFLIVAESEAECGLALDIALLVFMVLGLGVNYGKVIPPTQEILFLGVIIDAKRRECRLDPERLKLLVEISGEWLSRKHATVRELLSLIGSLQWAAKVVAPARTFLRRLIDQSQRASHLDAIIHLGSECKKDIAWFAEFLPDWNGVRFFQDDRLLDADSLGLVVFSDAASPGGGACFGDEWFSYPWPATVSDLLIAFRELHALTTAALTWGHCFSGRRIRFYCDSGNTIVAVKSGSIRNSDMMSLIRQLHIICTVFNFTIHIEQIPSAANVSDPASRFRFEELKARRPSIRDDPCQFTLPELPGEEDSAAMFARYRAVLAQKRSAAQSSLGS